MRAKLSRFWFCFLVIGLFQCFAINANAYTKTYAQEQIRLFTQFVKSNLPIPFGEILSITSINFDEKKNQLIYTAQILNEPYDNQFTLLEDSEVKNNLKQSLLSNLDKDMLKILVDAGCSIKYSYYSTSGAEIRDVILEHQDLNQWYAEKLNGNADISYLSRFKREVESYKTRLPIKIKDGISITDCSIDGSTIKYVYTYDVAAPIFDGATTKLMKDSSVKYLRTRIGANCAKVFAQENIVIICAYYDYTGNLVCYYTITYEDF